MAQVRQRWSFLRSRRLGHGRRPLRQGCRADHRAPPGIWEAAFVGRRVTAKNAERLHELEEDIRFNGMYPYRCRSEEVEALTRDEDAQEQLLERLATESVAEWLTLADERLRDSSIAVLRHARETTTLGASTPPLARTSRPKLRSADRSTSRTATSCSQSRTRTQLPGTAHGSCPRRRARCEDRRPRRAVAGYAPCHLQPPRAPTRIRPRRRCRTRR